MKIIEKLNRESSHHTIGLNVFSLISAVMTWAHLTDHLTWWALPITILITLIAYGSEIQTRNTNTTVRF